MKIEIRKAKKGDEKGIVNMMKEGLLLDNGKYVDTYLLGRLL